MLYPEQSWLLKLRRAPARYDARRSCAQLVKFNNNWIKTILLNENNIIAGGSLWCAPTTPPTPSAWSKTTELEKLRDQNNIIETMNYRIQTAPLNQNNIIIELKQYIMAGGSLWCAPTTPPTPSSAPSATASSTPGRAVCPPLFDHYLTIIWPLFDHYLTTDACCVLQPQGVRPVPAARPRRR